MAARYILSEFALDLRRRFLALAFNTHNDTLRYRLPMMDETCKLIHTRRASTMINRRVYDKAQIGSKYGMDNAVNRYRYRLRLRMNADRLSYCPAKLDTENPKPSPLGLDRW